MNDDELRRLADDIDERVNRGEALSCLFAGKPFISLCVNREACLALAAVLLKLATEREGVQADGNDNWRRSYPARQLSESGSAYRIDFVQRVNEFDEPDDADISATLRPRDRIATVGCFLIFGLVLFLLGSGVWHWLSKAFV